MVPLTTTARRVAVAFAPLWPEGGARYGLLVLARDDTNGGWVIDAEQASSAGVRPRRSGVRWEFTVNAAIRGLALADLMSECVPLGYRVAAGYRPVRLGHRVLGILTPDAEDALSELHHLVSELGSRRKDLIPVFDAEDWIRLSDDLEDRIRAARAPADLDRIVAAERRAAVGRALIRGDLRAAMLKRQDRHSSAARKELLEQLRRA